MSHNLYPYSTYLGSVDELVGEALSDGLDVPEGGLTGSGAQQPDGLVDATQGRHVDGLTTDGTGTTDTGRVFTGSAVDDGVDHDLQGVLWREEMSTLLRVDSRQDFTILWIE